MHRRLRIITGKNKNKKIIKIIIIIILQGASMKQTVFYLVLIAAYIEKE